MLEKRQKYKSCIFQGSFDFETESIYDVTVADESIIENKLKAIDIINLKQ